MSFSLPLACRPTASPQVIQRPKYVPLVTPIKTLTTKTATKFLSPQCKPLFCSSNTNNSFFRYAAGDGEGALVTEQLSEEKYKEERDSIVQKIEVLEIKLKELSSQKKDVAVLESVLKDSVALGHQVTNLESKNPIPSTPNSTTELFDNILKEFQGTLALRDTGLVTVEPNPNPGPTSEWIDQMVREVVLEYYNEEDPLQLDHLGGNYAPIRKETPSRDAFVVEGQLPSTLNGVYLRVGPDAKFDPEANYQILDGDGMVHGVRIQDGQAKYTSHYVKNSRFLQESEFGKATMFKYGDLRGAYGVFVAFIQSLRARLDVLDMSFGHTTSNVGVIYHAGRFMALEDFGKPHVVAIGEDGNMETVGMNTYNGQLNHNFSPHPKKDPITGEMLLIALSHFEPYAHYTVINKEGVITSDVPLTVSGPTYMHDFAITENYSIIMDNPYVFDTQSMVRKDKWVFHFDATQKSRYGIIPRNASDESNIKWFEFDTPSFIFHTLNAWEEGETIIMYGCDMQAQYNARSDDYDIYPLAFRGFSNKAGANVTFTLPQLYKFTFNTTTGEATKEKIPTVGDLNLDNPKINETYMGRKCRYGYTNMFNDDGQTYGIYKHDLESGEGIAKKIKIDLEEAFLSEHVFVPRENPTSEDDGYLLLFAHMELKENTHFVVLDALDMSLVASVDLQARIPYGFHAIFVNQEELQAQAKTPLS